MTPEQAAEQYIKDSFVSKAIYAETKQAFLAGVEYGKEGLEKIISDTWEVAIQYKNNMLYDGNDENRVPDKQQYINSILNH